MARLLGGGGAGPLCCTIGGTVIAPGPLPPVPTPLNWPQCVGRIYRIYKRKRYIVSILVGAYSTRYSKIEASPHKRPASLRGRVKNGAKEIEARASQGRRKRSGWSGFGRTNIEGESGRVHIAAACRRDCKSDRHVTLY